MSFASFLSLAASVNFFEHSEIVTFIVVRPRLAKIKEWVDAHDPGALVIPLSGAFESKLLDMEEEEKKKYCEEQKTQRWGPTLYGYLEEHVFQICLCK